MKIAICDDEKNIREQMKTVLEKIDKNNEINLYSDGDKLLASDVLSYDVIFLDIEMGKVGGLNAAKMIRERQRDHGKDIWGGFPLLIFVTGYREHMPEAFLVHAFGYVVKPVDEKAFEKLYREALEEYSKRTNEKKEIIVKIGDKLQKIPLMNIVYIESNGRKNVIHTMDDANNKEEISYYGALREIETELPFWFFRIHKGYIVNMRMIRQYTRSQMKLADGNVILISKYRYAEFVSAYMEYLR